METLADVTASKQPAKVKTSITKERLRKFLETAKPRAQLYCDHIQGFYVQQATRKPVFKFRYTDPTGKRRDLTIGNAKAMPIINAASMAIDWRTGLVTGEADPTAKREALAAKITAQRLEIANKDRIKVGVYIEIYHRELAKKCGDFEARCTINSIKKHFAALNNRTMDSLAREDVRAWEAAKKNEGLSRSSMQSYLAAFKTMLNFAAGTKKKHENESPVISINPIANVFLSQCVFRPTLITHSGFT